MGTVCLLPLAAGARCVPKAESVPTAAASYKVTAVLLEPVTVAVNHCDPLAFKLTLRGPTETDRKSVV